MNLNPCGILSLTGMLIGSLVGRVRRGSLRRNPTLCANHVGLRDETANPTYMFLNLDSDFYSLLER